MEIAILSLIFMVVFTAWLGGGRERAFRACLSMMIMGTLGVSAFGVYSWVAGRQSAERAVAEAKAIHECAIAKVARQRQSEKKQVQEPELKSELLSALVDDKNAMDVEAAEKECSATEDRNSPKVVTEEIEDYIQHHPAK